MHVLIFETVYSCMYQVLHGRAVHIRLLNKPHEGQQQLATLLLEKCLCTPTHVIWYTNEYLHTYVLENLVHVEVLTAGSFRRPCSRSSETVASSRCAAS